jgi:hypothetical protein
MGEFLYTYIQVLASKAAQVEEWGILIPLCQWGQWKKKVKNNPYKDQLLDSTGLL